MTPFRSVLLLGSVVALAACQPAASPEAEAPAAAGPEAPAAAPAPEPVQAQLAASARATLSPLGDSGVGGELVFDVADGGVRVTGTLTGLQPGATHALHVHEFGDCSAPDGTSAGGHFNPDMQPHGDRAAGGAHHAGDIPNQTAGDNGEAVVDQSLSGLEIASGGANDIVGKGVIVHAQADDYATQPTGNAGGRIACGVIELANPAPADAGPAE
ncbi:MAG TPA: superoxide dismutase family protein [Arenimonas sp.]|uniref:superoxide dismutase family protein n=1 Tax=Arenimonas sp. TaxID=1872635 RepID=UPI002D7FF561|nr:superoxide dismutase family protein [Arenimonas sp.]HEU0154032.1 superoxide dismutase family protein [Arenimonas sp.]